MKKISQIIIKILLILLIIQFIYAPTCHASFWGDIFDLGKIFLEEGKASGATMISGSAIKTEFNKIYNILFALGVVLTVIIGAALGIKFMFGSVEDQAKVKETLIPYVVGCVIIFSAFGIWKLMVTLLSGL